MATTTKTIRVNLLRREERKAKAPKLPAIPKLSVGGGRAVKIAGLVLVLEIVGFVAWDLTLYLQAQSYQTEIAKLEKEEKQLTAQLAELDFAQAAKREIQRRLDIIGRVAKSQELPVAMMNGVLRAVPEGLWLTELDVKPQEVRRRVEEPHPISYSSETLAKLEAKKEQTQAGRPRGRQQGREVTELEGFAIVIKGMAFSNFQIAEFMENLRDAGVFSDVDFSVTQATNVEQVRVMNFEVTAAVKL